MSPVLNSVSSDLVPTNVSALAWLGARHEAGWGWSDGTTWQYDNWGEGEPKTGNGCVAMLTGDGRDGTWRSLNCMTRRNFYWCKIH